MRLRSFQPQEMSGNNIEDVISAPLMAVAHANSMMQREQTKFLMETAFKFVNGVHEPQMIEMQLIQHQLDQSDPQNPKMVKQETVFNIPLLTLIPFNSLAVDELNVEFEMEITNQYEEDRTTGLLTAKNSDDPKPKTQMKGRISYDSKEKSDSKNSTRRQNNSSLKVNLHAGTLPLPTGVTTIMDLYLKSIHPYEPENKNNNSTTDTTNQENK